ncbi:hypothetical protein AU190_04660 [Mycolicibacterium acapulense]|nr:hypothetical protein AU189_11595 [Mycolicibacterium acapulense]KUI08625.1 hypothetical protein AU190_04660 [Mycolicibacterium acapulense]
MGRDGKRRTIHFKAIAAVLGGGAIVALTALGTAVDKPSGPTSIAIPRMTVGATDTQTTPSEAPGVGRAEPTIKGPAPFAVKR